jgi:hypothetical protein
MGLWVPPVSWDAYQSNVTTPTTGTSVTAGGTAHVKNTTYTTLIASTNFDAYAIEIKFSDVGTVVATDSSMLVDIAIGAAASETVIIPNLVAGAAAAQATIVPGGQHYWFPLYIPTGSRISATAQAVIVSDTVLTTVRLWGDPSSPIWAGSEVIDYGTNAAASQGTAVAAGVSGAEGTFTQITASTTRTHYYVAAGISNAGDVTSQQGGGVLDIGVGAATEDPIAEDYWFTTTANEDISHKPIGIAAQIPSATRLTARISQGSATAQNWDVILYGVS